MNTNIENYIRNIIPEVVINTFVYDSEDVTSENKVVNIGSFVYKYEKRKLFRKEHCEHIINLPIIFNNEKVLKTIMSHYNDLYFRVKYFSSPQSYNSDLTITPFMHISEMTSTLLYVYNAGENSIDTTTYYRNSNIAEICFFIKYKGEYILLHTENNSRIKFNIDDLFSFDIVSKLEELSDSIKFIYVKNDFAYKYRRTQDHAKQKIQYKEQITTKYSLPEIEKSIDGIKLKEQEYEDFKQSKRSTKVFKLVEEQ